MRAPNVIDVFICDRAHQKAQQEKRDQFLGHSSLFAQGRTWHSQYNAQGIYRVWAKLFRHALQTRVIARKQKPHRRHNAITSRRNTCPNCAFLCSAVQHKYMRPKIQQVKTKSTTIESRGAGPRCDPVSQPHIASRSENRT